MKKSICLFTFVLCFSIAKLFAYDYQTTYSDLISFFENGDNFKGLKIDSVKIENTDSIFYFVKNLQQIDIDEFNPQGASFLGDKVIIREGWNFFFNEDNDTIKIKTDANLNESWIAFCLEDSLSVKATVTAHEKQTFLGLEDWVKTINFQVFDNKKNPLQHELDNKSIMISKNHGFVKALNFIVFPQAKEYDYSDKQYWDLGYYNQLSAFSLTGLSNPKIGTQNLTWLDVNDFDVNDEIHVEFLEDYFLESRVSKKTILKCIHKEVSANEKTYKVERKEYSYDKRYNSGDIVENSSYRHDTISSTIKSDLAFDRIHGEFSGSGAIMSMSKNGNEKCEHFPQITEENGVWQHSLDLFDGLWMSPPVYLKGLGGPYYYSEDNIGLNEHYRKLVYYKKGDVVWGQPLTMSGIDNLAKEERVQLLSNPVKDILQIKISDRKAPCSFELFDLNGRLLTENKLDFDINSIDLSAFSDGIYIYRIKENGKIIHSGKIIKSA